MRILVILPRVPFPPRDGGAIVMANTLRGLRELGHELVIHALEASRSPGDAALLAGVASAYSTTVVNTHVTIPGALQSLLPSRRRSLGLPRAPGYWVDRFLSASAVAGMKRLLEQHGPVDAVFCETLFSAWYGIRARAEGLIAPSVPLILHAHNVEYRIQEHLAVEAGRGPIERWYRRYLAAQTKAFETWALAQCDAVIALSEQDARIVHREIPDVHVVAIPPSVDLVEGATYRPTSRDLSYIGSLDWQPNQAGLRWFVNDVLPRIAEAIPDVHLHVAGRGVSPSLTAELERSHVTVHGLVEDANAFRAAHGPMVIPLFSGSGVRIKILEAFAGSTPVVSTSRGAEGLAVEHGVQIQVADDPAGFAHACIHLLTHPEAAAEQARQAQQWVAGGFGHESVTNRIGALITEEVRRRTT